MLSMGGCTNTQVGMLLAPSAEAVTCTAPEPPGVQVVKAISKCPAQATPLGAMFRTEVSLDEKVMGVERLVPEAVCTDAVKIITAPWATEVLLEGLRLTFPGNSGGPALPPPPHPVMLHINRIATVRQREFECEFLHTDIPLHRNLPMHPSKHCVSSASETCRTSRRMNW